MSKAEIFRIDIAQKVLDDLRERIERTRWPADLDNDHWLYGVNAVYLRALAHQWAQGFDWRGIEAQMNHYRHFRVLIDGQPIHFVRIPGKGPAPIPLILSHGWPWTFWDMRRVMGPLSDPGEHGGDPLDAFELIIPSLPGFGFSSPPPRSGMNFWKTADLWHQLMTEVLGFERYAAAGADWGAIISAQLGHKYASSVVGIHIAQALAPNLFNHERPWDVTRGQVIPGQAAPDLRRAFTDWQRRFASHVAVQVIEPQTLAYGIHDSPVAQLAWLLQRWRTWGDRGSNESCLPTEQMLADATLYWVTESFVFTARYYADAAHDPWMPTHGNTPMVGVPTGITFLGGELWPGASTQTCVQSFLKTRRASLFNIHHLNAHPVGGHFAHFENPTALVADIRATFRALRH